MPPPCTAPLPPTTGSSSKSKSGNLSSPLPRGSPTSAPATASAPCHGRSWPPPPPRRPRQRQTRHYPRRWCRRWQRITPPSLLRRGAPPRLSAPPRAHPDRGCGRRRGSRSAARRRSPSCLFLNQPPRPRGRRRRRLRWLTDMLRPTRGGRMVIRPLRALLPVVGVVGMAAVVVVRATPTTSRP